MSADNCIAILHTRDLSRKLEEATWVADPDGVDTWRVAHIQGPDDFEYLRENQIHNLGHWMASLFRDEPIYSQDEALARARELARTKSFLEHGILTLDASSLNFPDT